MTEVETKPRWMPDSPRASWNPVSQIRNLLQNCSSSNRPSTTLLPTSTTSTPAVVRNDDLSPTVWLDGVRGLAALMVMAGHFHMYLFDASKLGAPWGGNDTSYELWRLPVIRLWMASGSFQVTVFFVLSGFVLSWGNLGLLRTGTLEKRTKSLSSAVFRRWTRLFLPCFGVALLYCVLFYVQLIDINSIERKSNFLLQLLDLVAADVRFANPFRIRDEYEAMHSYEGSMWSIPIEFAGSIFIYVLLLGIWQINDYKRRAFVTIGIALYAASVAQYPFFLFASGLCVADYVRARGGFRRIDERQTWLSTIVWSALFSMSLFMGGMPAPGTSFAMNGYGFLVALIPSQWMATSGGSGFWWCVGAITLLMSASHLRYVKNFFAMSLPRYLGRISFMLYLSHRASLKLVYRHLKPVIFPMVGLAGREHIGEEGSEWLQNAFAYFLMMAILVPVAMIVAHLLLISIDNPSVRFAKWFETLFVTRIVANAHAHVEERQSVPGGEEESVELLDAWPDGHRKELESQV